MNHPWDSVIIDPHEHKDEKNTPSGDELARLQPSLD